MGSSSALAFSPSSPLYELLCSSMSMASCFVLSIKLLRMVRWTDLAPSLNCEVCACVKGGGGRVEGGGWKAEGGGWKVEGGGWRVESGGWRA